MPVHVGCQTTGTLSTEQDDGRVHLKDSIQSDIRPEDSFGEAVPSTLDIWIIRLLFLSYYGSLGSILPFKSVYFHSLGHGNTTIGMIGAIKPFVSFLAAPLWGAISDWTQRPFLTLQVTLLVSVLGQVLLVARSDQMYILILVLVTAVFQAPVKSLIDSTVMSYLPDRSSYGRQRLFGQIGFALATFVMGYLSSQTTQNDTSSLNSPIDTTGTFAASLPTPLQTLVTRAVQAIGQLLTGYRIFFFAHGLLAIPAWICLVLLQRGRKRNGISQRKGTAQSMKTESTASSASQIVPQTSLVTVLRNPDALLFFFLVFCVGMNAGVSESFANLRLKEVGGTSQHMGLARLVGAFFGVPMFWFSGSLSKRLGTEGVLAVTLSNYSLRYFIYAYMTSPMHALPAEAIRGLTFAMFWSSATVHAHKISPPGLNASVLMMTNALYSGLGQSLGALFAGSLESYGLARTFSSVATLDMALVGLLLVHASLRVTEKKLTEEKQTKPKKKMS